MPAPPSGRPPLGLYCTAGRSIRLAQRAAANQDDYRALLGWCRAYRAWLDGNGWIDRAELEAALTGGTRRAGQARRRRSRRALPGSRQLCWHTLPRRARRSKRHRRLPPRAPVAPPSSPTPPTSCARRSHGPNGISRPTRPHASPSSSPRPRGAKTRSSDWRQPSSAALTRNRTGAKAATLGGEAAIGAALDALRAVRRACSLCNLRPLATQSVFCAAVGRAVRVRTARRRAARRAALAAAVPSGLSLRSEGAARSTRTALGARARGCAWRHRWRAPCDSGSVGASMDALARRARLATADGARDVARMAKHARRAGTTDADRRRDLARRRPSRARSTARAHDACWLCRSAGCTSCGASKTSVPDTTPSGLRDSRTLRGPNRRTAIRCLPIALQREHGMPYSSPRDAEERSRRAARAARSAEPRARRELAGARVRLRNGAEPRDSIVAARCPPTSSTR